MTEFKASNGYTILARENATVDWWSADGVHKGIIQVFTHSQVWDALREFFAYEASKQPWDDAQRGDVWLFSNESDSQRALGWRGPTGWDAIDPKGNFHSSIADVPSEMESHSLYGWDKPQAKLIYRIGDAS